MGFAFVGHYGAQLPVKRRATVPIRVLEHEQPSDDDERRVLVEATLPGSFAATVGLGDTLSIRSSTGRLTGTVETVEAATPSSALEAPARAGASQPKLRVRLRVAELLHGAATGEPMWLEADGPTERLYDVLFRGTPLARETT